jgi:hypothetical protein
MTLPKINKKIVGVGVFILTFILFWPAITLHMPEPSKYIDTVVSIKKVPLVTISKKDVAQPLAVTKYAVSKDERATVEKSDIITSVKIYKPFFSNVKRLDVTRIDTLGLAYKNQYLLSDFKEIDIDHIGNVSIKRKKKLITKILIVAIPCVMATAGLKLGYDIWRRKHY